MVLTLVAGACGAEPEAVAPASSTTPTTRAPATSSVAPTTVATSGTTTIVATTTTSRMLEAQGDGASASPAGTPEVDRELLLHLDVGCLDSVLGMARTDQILYGDAEPTAAEVAAVSGCPEGEPHDEPLGEHGYVPPTGGSQDQTQAGNGSEFHGTPWTPSPNDAECLFASIGATSFRAVYQGFRQVTAAEIEAAQPCLHGGLQLSDVPHPLSRVPCPSLDLLNLHLRDYRPRWDQLSCHTDGLARLPVPAFRASARFAPVRTTRIDGGNCQGTDCRELLDADTGVWSGDLAGLIDTMLAGSWAEFARSEYDGRDRDLVAALRFTEAEFPAANASFLPVADFPPYIDEEYRLIEYPPSGYWHDQAMRAYAVHVIQRKQAGHLTWMVDFWPPGMDESPAANLADFRSWVDAVLIPQKVHEAKVAEALKVELFTPWPNEIERFVLAQSWTDTASDEDLLLAGQYLLDAVADAVRPHFSGRILPMSYVHHERDRVIWRDLSFRGFEEVAFGVFAECDEATALDYLRGQLATIMTIVERDMVDWSVGEMELNDRHFTELCGTDLEEQADEIHAAMLDLLFTQEIPPVGVSLLGNVYSQEHRVALDRHLFSRLGVGDS